MGRAVIYAGTARLTSTGRAGRTAIAARAVALLDEEAGRRLRVRYRAIMPARSPSFERGDGHTRPETRSAPHRAPDAPPARLLPPVPLAAPSSALSGP